jgi:peptide chain release factor 1
MEEKLASIKARYEELTRQMADPDIANDYTRYADIAKQHNELKEIVEVISQHEKVVKDLADNKALAAEGDKDFAEMAAAEIPGLEAQIESLNGQLKRMLVPKDPRDEKNVTVEIRAGAGGDEAGLFAAELYRLYSRYAEARRWKTEEMSINEAGGGGIKEVIFEVRGKGAYSRLKWESGVHRVQRIPATEANGRIHTSTVTVAVLPQLDEVEVRIPDGDIEVETRRSRGAGGQNVQKNESAVRITHKPTGMVVDVQDERSQTQNRLRAMSILRARLFELEQAKRDASLTAERQAQVGTGERNEKIRTYNFPQSRVTDHRIGKSIYNMVGIMNGGIDDFIDELSANDVARKLGEAVAVAADDDD